MSRVAEVALEVVLGQFTPFDADNGYCLRNLREICERALGLASGEFYSLYRTEVSERNTTGEPWAVDLQKSLRAQGRGVPTDERQSGDLIFTHEIAPAGHCGVLFSPDLLIENTGSRRGVQISGYNRLSRVDLWPAAANSVEVFRLD